MTGPHEQQAQSEQDAQEFVSFITHGRGTTEEYVLELPSEIAHQADYEGPREITLDLSPILDRQTRYDYQERLPAGWFEASRKDSVDDVDIGSLVPDGDGIGALEDMVLDAADHPHISPSAMEAVVREGLSDNVVTEMGLQVLQMSSDDDVHKITSFRGPGDRAGDGDADGD